MNIYVCVYKIHVGEYSLGTETLLWNETSFSHLSLLCANKLQSYDHREFFFLAELHNQSRGKELLDGGMGPSVGWCIKCPLITLR